MRLPSSSRGGVSGRKLNVSSVHFFPPWFYAIEDKRMKRKSKTHGMQLKDEEMPAEEYPVSKEMMEEEER